ncbi:MAG: hypothetical protein CO020_00020 [Candidatus Colwellbacteria bacterium CG_4_9_14_0_2_um_filter_50_12]|uniref:Uncharacterized protein n=1 Tax=Candidatus Colwellbacteria bacterium CG_4_9_14_0_2_um_filter_50_12 TaxID=1974538 RepID=A0A2M8G1M4_9BACT|nr:MAG: hypothetical protein CO020_00020 [Candidatus Colwellbacteria bacterium CG_4_9_14_0_2_um_filter_50_12]
MEAAAGPTVRLVEAEAWAARPLGKTAMELARSVETAGPIGPPVVSHLGKVLGLATLPAKSYFRSYQNYTTLLTTNSSPICG